MRLHLHNTSDGPVRFRVSSHWMWPLVLMLAGLMTLIARSAAWGLITLARLLGVPASAGWQASASNWLRFSSWQLVFCANHYTV